MAVRFDMRQLIAARTKLADLQERKVHELTQKLTLDVGRKLIEGSPVDTGELRGKWEIETPSTPGDVGRVSNTTPYSPYVGETSSQVEEGWIENAIEGAVKFGGNT